MQRLLLYLLCIAALVSACTLTTNEPDDEPIPTTAVSVIITQTNSATETPRPTQTTAPQATSTNPPSVPVCYPRTDWGFTYIVVSGDTLNKIAARVDSSAEALRQGNCLRDANQISIGQTLRVPQQPAPPTATTVPPTTTNPLPDQVGGISFDEYISADAEGVHLLRDDWVTIRWVDAPAGLTSAEFVIAQQGFPVDPNAHILHTLGTDTNFTDGVSIPWQVWAGLRGEQVTAIGRYSNTNRVVTSFRLFVSSAPLNGQGCQIGPVTGTVDTYYAPDSNAQVSGLLQEGWMVEVMGRSLNGWYAFNPSGGPEVSIPNLRWLDVNGTYKTQGNC